MHVLLNKLTYCYFDVLVEVAIVVAKTLYEWNALNAITRVWTFCHSEFNDTLFWSKAFLPSIFVARPP